MSRATAGLPAPRLGQDDDWGGGVRRTPGTGISKQRLPKRSELPAPQPNYAPVPNEEEEEEDTPQYADYPAAQTMSRHCADFKPRTHHCPECFKSYANPAGLYQHKRAHHPWLINTQTRVPFDDEERRFICLEPGCDKAYTTSMGLYQHKRAKHPWLVKQRERGYARPGYNKKS